MRRLLSGAFLYLSLAILVGSLIAMVAATVDAIPRQPEAHWTDLGTVIDDTAINAQATSSTMVIGGFNQTSLFVEHTWAASTHRGPRSTLRSCAGTGCFTTQGAADATLALPARRTGSLGPAGWFTARLISGYSAR